MNENVLPFPGSLSTQSWPPIRFTIRTAILSPRPVPPYLRVVEPSACRNGSKIRAWCSDAMPIPVSCTMKRSDAVSGASRSLSVTRSDTCPASVNFIALPMRFTRTCAILC